MHNKFQIIIPGLFVRIYIAEKTVDIKNTAYCVGCQYIFDSDSSHWIKILMLKAKIQRLECKECGFTRQERIRFAKEKRAVPVDLTGT